MKYLEGPNQIELLAVVWCQISIARKSVVVSIDQNPFTPL